MLIDYDVLWFPLPSPELDSKVSEALGVELNQRFVAVNSNRGEGAKFRTFDPFAANGNATASQ